MDTKNTILQIDNLKVQFKVDKRTVHAVNDVNLTVHRGKILGIVGESGCGKSVTAHSILQLLPPNGKIANGKISFAPDPDGPVLELQSMKRSGKDIRAIRGQKISMIFQDPMMSLNPVYPIGKQILENLRIHEKKLDRKAAQKRVVDLLSELGIPEAEQRFSEYPHQFSGGMKQRVMIAIAMICNPNLLIADEPTTALDVTIQKQVLVLLNKLKKDVSTGVLFITHDLGVVAEIADRVIILYSGCKVEEGDINTIFSKPLHPYTIGLMNAVPNVDKDDFEIQPIPGTFPNITEEIGGCRFHPRCPYATDRCRAEVPAGMEVEPGHFVACHKVEEEMRK